MKQKRKRVSVVVIDQGKILGFHAEDPHSKQRYFFLPGGGIEEGEEPLQAAVRETLEETGYSIEVDPNSKIFERYDFEWNGKIHDCETWFYRGKLISSEQNFTGDTDYHRGVDWIPLAEVSQVFAYHPKIREAVETLSGDQAPQSTWDRYYQKMLNRPLRPLYLQGIEFWKGASGVASDLGCGIGNEVMDLLKRGWSVHAIDKEAAGIQSLLTRAGTGKKLSTSIQAFESFKHFPKVDILFSFHALSFSNKEHFAKVLERAIESVNAQGLFVGTLFGPQDDWVQWDFVAGISEEKMKEAFHAFEILHFKEVKGRERSANGPEKNWHFYEIIARRK